MNILVVVDMQNDFLTGSLANPDAVKIVPGIVEEIKSDKYDCMVFTMDVHSNKYLDTIEGKHLPVPHCVHGTDGENIDVDVVCSFVKAMEKGISVDLILKNSFGSIELKDFVEKKYAELKKNDCEGLNITLVGTCTDICVISNALILKSIPYAEVSVIEHLCAGTTPENHENAIKAMRQCHVNIL